jgi:hypothetical protein
MATGDPTGTRMMVYHIVVSYFAPLVNEQPTDIDISRTFSGSPPGGYGQVPGAFMSMCDAITPQLQSASCRAVTLSVSWRIQHQGDTIETFINQVAIEVLAAPLSDTGKNALGWAIS